MTVKQAFSLTNLYALPIIRHGFKAIAERSNVGQRNMGPLLKKALEEVEWVSHY